MNKLSSLILISLLLGRGTRALDTLPARLMMCPDFARSYEQAKSMFIQNSMAVQSDGKIISTGFERAGGHTRVCLERRLPDGSPDVAFGKHGHIYTSFGAAQKYSNAHALVIQNDGKIVIAGFTDAAQSTLRASLARYNPDGSLDTSFFGGMGIVPGTVITAVAPESRSEITALALQPDGKIVAAGNCYYSDHSEAFIARYHSDGTLDSSFRSPESLKAGIVPLKIKGDRHNDIITAVAIQSDGKIVVTGASSVFGVPKGIVARYMPYGCLDESFGADSQLRVPGIAILDAGIDETHGTVHALLIQKDGTIIVAGSTNAGCSLPDQKRPFLASFYENGSRTMAFADRGHSQERSARPMIIHSLIENNNSILAVGYEKQHTGSSSWIARYTNQGELEQLSIPEFIRENVLEHCCSALQKDGCVLIGSRCVKMNDSLIEKLLSYDHSDRSPVITAPVPESILVNGADIVVEGTVAQPGILELLLNGQCIKSWYCNDAQWSSVLPALANGIYCVQVRVHYPSARMNSVSQEIFFSVDQEPVAASAQQVIYGAKEVSGTLHAAKASGQYEFSVLSTTNGSAHIEGNTYTFTPLIEEGTATLTYQVQDRVSKCTSQATVAIEIHRTVQARDDHKETYVEQPVRGSFSSLARFGKPPYYYRILQEPRDGTVHLLPDQEYEFTPKENFVGNTSFDYETIDSTHRCSYGKIYIEVLPIPELVVAPLAVYNGRLALYDLASLPIKNAAQPCTFELIRQPAHAFVELSSSGSASIIPDANWQGDDAIAIRIIDVRGLRSKTIEIPLHIYSLPRTNDASWVIDQGQCLCTNLASQVKGGIPPYRFEIGHYGPECTVSLSSENDGACMIVPCADFSGETSCEYRVYDARGVKSNDGHITMAVQRIPKIKKAGVIEIKPTHTLIGTLAYNVEDGVSPYQFYTKHTDSNFTLNPDGSYVIALPSDLPNDIRFTYFVRDAHGATSKEAQLVIRVKHQE